MFISHKIYYKRIQQSVRYIHSQFNLKKAVICAIRKVIEHTLTSWLQMIHPTKFAWKHAPKIQSSAHPVPKKIFRKRVSQRMTQKWCLWLPKSGCSRKLNSIHFVTFKKKKKGWRYAGKEMRYGRCWNGCKILMVRRLFWLAKLSPCGKISQWICRNLQRCCKVKWVNTHGLSKKSLRAARQNTTLTSPLLA